MSLNLGVGGSFKHKEQLLQRPWGGQEKAGSGEERGAGRVGQGWQGRWRLDLLGALGDAGEPAFFPKEQ